VADVTYGTMPTLPANPDPDYAVSGYDISWPTFVAATADAVYTATYTASKPDTPTVTPGEQSETIADAAAAAAAAAAITANPTEYVVAPAALNSDPTAKAAYQNMFQAKTVEVAGGYKIELELTSDATAALTADATAKAETVAASLSEIAAAAVGSTKEIAVTGAKPGFYYWVSYGTAVGSLDRNGAAGQAGANGSVTLTTPAKASGATSGFYRVNVGVTAPAAE